MDNPNDIKSFVDKRKDVLTKKEQEGLSKIASLDNGVDKKEKIEGLEEAIEDNNKQVKFWETRDQDVLSGFIKRGIRLRKQLEELKNK